MKRGRQPVLSAAALLVGVAAAWTLMANRPQITSQKLKAEPPVVEVVRVTPDTVRLNVRSQGVVRPRTEIDLVSEVAGRVTRIHPGFAAGGFFERGEVLIALDPRDYEDAIIKAEAEVAKADRALLQEEAEGEQARSEWQALGEGESTPLTLREPQLRERRAQLRAAQAALAEARRRRQRCELRAPFAGQVREKRVDVGQYVAIGEKLARLYAVDAVEVRLPIAQEELRFLDLPLAYRNVGQSQRWPTVTLSASLAGRTYEWQGQIVRTEGAWDEQTGVLYAIAEVRDPYAYRQDRPSLAVGLYVQAEIEGQERPQVYVLPSSAFRGVREVAGPVVLAVVVAGVAFLPGLFLPGWAGQMMGPICLVMILTLVFSLIEALLILPAHLAKGPPHPNPLSPGERGWSWSERLRTALNGGLAGFVERRYRPWLQRVLEWRYLALALFAALLLCTSVLVAGGYVRLSFNPDVTKDTLWVELKIPPGTPFAETRALARRVEQAFFDLRTDLNRRQPEGAPSVISQLESLIYENWAGFWLEVAPHARQWLDIEAMVHNWRARLGDLGRAKIDFHYREGDTGYDLEFDLSAPDPALLTQGAAVLKEKLAAYPGVFDVNDSAAPGKPEVRLALTPGAERLGLRLKELAEQVRGGFYGEEVQRLVRGSEEVKVMCAIRLLSGSRSTVSRPCQCACLKAALRPSGRSRR